MTSKSTVDCKEITVAMITSRELEAGLDDFLTTFVHSGHAEKVGAVLIKSLPLSK
jgi:hypothetical protein